MLEVREKNDLISFWGCFTEKRQSSISFKGGFFSPKKAYYLKKWVQGTRSGVKIILLEVTQLKLL